MVLAQQGKTLVVGMYIAVLGVLAIWVCRQRYLSATCFQYLTGDSGDSCPVLPVLGNLVYAVRCFVCLMPCTLGRFYKRVSFLSGEEFLFRKLRPIPIQSILEKEQRR